MKQPRSYPVILREMAVPEVFALGAILCAIPFITYAGVTIHIYAFPVFHGELAQTIAQIPKYEYWLNALIWCALTLVAVKTYIQKKHGE